MDGAGDEADSANFVMPGCRDYIASPGKENLLQQGVCIGWVAGLFDVVNLFGGTLGPCPPASVTKEQAVRVVASYIDARPTRLHEDFTTLALEAFLAAWPCRK